MSVRVKPGIPVPVMTLPVPDPTREMRTRPVPDPRGRVGYGETRGYGDTRRPLISIHFLIVQYRRLAARVMHVWYAVCLVRFLYVSSVLNQSRLQRCPSPCLT